MFSVQENREMMHGKRGSQAEVQFCCFQWKQFHHITVDRSLDGDLTTIGADFPCASAENGLAPLESTLHSMETFCIADTVAINCSKLRFEHHAC